MERKQTQSVNTVKKTEIKEPAVFYLWTTCIHAFSQLSLQKTLLFLRMPCQQHYSIFYILEIEGAKVAISCYSVPSGNYRTTSPQAKFKWEHQSTFFDKPLQSKYAGGLESFQSLCTFTLQKIQSKDQLDQIEQIQILRKVFHRFGAGGGDNFQTEFSVKVLRVSASLYCCPLKNQAMLFIQGEKYILYIHPNEFLDLKHFIVMLCESYCLVISGHQFPQREHIYCDLFCGKGWLSFSETSSSLRSCPKIKD